MQRHVFLKRVKGTSLTLEIILSTMQAMQVYIRHRWPNREGWGENVNGTRVLKKETVWLACSCRKAAQTKTKQVVESSAWMGLSAL